MATKTFFLLLCFILLSCSKSSQVYAPVGGLSKDDMNVSKNRAKNLNQIERQQIQAWISSQSKKFYSMGLNYWVDIENLDQRSSRKDGEHISYQYDLYDFDEVKLYEKPKINREVVFGKFEELKAVEDALRYLNKGEEATLLVPSVLAFGTFGDNDQIPNDMPLIIKLKVLNH
ncbi:MAG: FKBP-type peptidyl-prolyl cis-trans isomerase [Cloacibacterium sp.]|nr:FKBP-type peptidyl-prolyl cis-trans isomerase [Cloacibacterium sp.]